MTHRYDVDSAPPVRAYVAPNEGWQSDPSARRPMTLIFGANTGYVIPNVWRSELAMRLAFRDLVELALDYEFYGEPMGVDTSGESIWDWISIGRLSLGFRVVDLESFVLRLDASARHWQDAAGPLFGAEGGVVMDQYDLHPFVIHCEVRGGIIGRAYTMMGRISLGVFVASALEFELGYQHLQIMSIEHAFEVPLSGPFVGMRIGSPMH